MEDPEKEIVDVVKLLTMGTREVQRETVEKYFMPDASFQHSICAVKSAPFSREKIAGVYQWYRDMSPKLSLEVESFAYDRKRCIMYLNITQKFHISISPFKPAPSRLLVRITLYKSPSYDLYYIQQQEDFYQPEDIMYLTIPPLAYLVLWLKELTGYVSWVLANIFHATGLDAVSRWIADMRS